VKKRVTMKARHLLTQRHKPIIRRIRSQKRVQHVSCLIELLLGQQHPCLPQRLSDEILATSGAGKSYLSKLQVLRSLYAGVEVLVIDPENEYERLAIAVGGSNLLAAWALLTRHHYGAQLGFVAGTAVVAVLNLADIMPSRALFAIAAILAAACNAATARCGADPCPPVAALSLPGVDMTISRRCSSGRVIFRLANCA
jgi:hypothetical protein